MAEYPSSGERFVETWNCVNGDCFDPGTGEGTYTTLKACIKVCPCQQQAYEPIDPTNPESLERSYTPWIQGPNGGMVNYYLEKKRVFQMELIEATEGDDPRDCKRKQKNLAQYIRFMDEPMGPNPDKEQPGSKVATPNGPI